MSTHSMHYFVSIHCSLHLSLFLRNMKLYLRVFDLEIGEISQVLLERHHSALFQIPQLSLRERADVLELFARLLLLCVSLQNHVLLIAVEFLLAKRRQNDRNMDFRK